MIYSNELWYLITNTRGVTGFVGPQGRPLPLTDEEVARNMLPGDNNKEVKEAPAAVGDTVQIVSGPLESFTGTVIDVNISAQKIKVSVEMFGRVTDVDVDFPQIKKVNVKKEEI